MNDTAVRTCSLCGLAAGRAPIARRFEDGIEQPFCCLGCMNVYAILRESGVLASGVDIRDTDLFKQSLRLGLIANAEASRKAAAPAIPADAETKETIYHVSGMWCSSCGWVIEHALAVEPGIVSAEVMFASDLLKIKYCPQYVPPGRITDRIATLGYRAGEYAPQADRDHSERRDLLLRIGVAAFLWLNVMTLSLVIYASYWEAISDSARRIVPLCLMALATPAVLYSAWPVLRIAAIGLRTFTLRMEALLALGIVAAYGYSAVQALTGGTHFYFDTACAIITLVLLGKLLERGAKERTAQSIALLYRMMPKKARLMAPDGRERFVSIEALEPGAVFCVKPGERIPADGQVVAGSSHVDESVLTGESAPRTRNPGDGVICGSLNAGGVLEIRATRVGADSTLSQIIRSVESAMSSRSAIERVVDRAARMFVPIVIGVAALAFFGGVAFGVDSATALMRAIAVLVIACPCALGIATPLAITAAVGAASRRGILVSDSRVLELVNKVDVMVLDKTGTVTEGDFAVLDLALPREVLPLVAAVEAYSEHPLGRASVRHAQSQGLSIPSALDIEIYKGQGIAGFINGRRIVVGNRRLVPGIEPALEARASQWEASGATVAFVSIDGRPAGAMAFGDRVRVGAPELIAALRARGIRTIMLSGDSEATTAFVARQTGVDEFRAGVPPDGKLALIGELKTGGRTVAMAGDGVNDAPALAAADLGIALGSGTDLAMRAAPVVLMSPALDRVLEVFDLSRMTLRTVRQNLFWAFFYNVAGITLAITGILNPILAAGAMVLSSLSVIGNSMRLGRTLGKRPV
jgi:heavy metal translocating P-type ATPase